MRPATTLAIAAAFVVAIVLVWSPTAPQTGALHILPCPDLDGDGQVTTLDIVVIESTWLGQEVPPAPIQADQDLDGDVDINDLNLIVAAFANTETCQDAPIGPKPDEPEMSLGAQGQIDCDGDGRDDYKPKQIEKPAKCTAIYNPDNPKKNEFQITIDANELPPGGYGGFFSELAGVCDPGPGCVAGWLTANRKPCKMEIVWPDSVKPNCKGGPARQPLHDDQTSNNPPHPLSTFTGTLVKVNAHCPGVGQFEVVLVALPSATGGTAYEDADKNVIPVKIVAFRNIDLDGDTTPESIGAADVLAINCVTPAKGALDADQDGCSDQAENGPLPELGGQRDYLNIWDVFTLDAQDAGGNNVGLGQGVALKANINIPNILLLASHFGDTGDTKIHPLSDATGPGYHTRFDRGPLQGDPPDGAVGILDILQMAAQFGLIC